MRIVPIDTGVGQTAKTWMRSWTRLPATFGMKSRLMQRGQLGIVSAQGDYGKPRPAVVIQNSRLLDQVDSVTVCFLTNSDCASTQSAGYDKARRLEWPSRNHRRCRSKR